MSSLSFRGNILKMRSVLENPVRYFLPIGDDEVELNSLLGREIEFSFTGEIRCIATGKKITKSYNQGYSFEAARTLARCDICMVRPELCHYDKGTCREPQWGRGNCFIPHYIYFAISSGLKVGITRETQIPTRWIDQGAGYALPILRVEDRKTAGLLEVEFAREYNDKTNWRQMLMADAKKIDLVRVRDQLFGSYSFLLDDYRAEDVDEEVVEIKYPVLSYPSKVTALNLDKNKIIKSKLIGIKGQYLIFESGVLNIRKYQGYEMELHLP